MSVDLCSTVQKYDIQFFVHTASTLTAMKIFMSRQKFGMYQEQYCNRPGPVA